MIKISIMYYLAIFISCVLLLSASNLVFSYDLNKIDSYTTTDYTNPFINPANIKPFTKEYGVGIKVDFGFGFNTTTLDSFKRVEQLIEDLDSKLDLNIANRLATEFNNLDEILSDEVQFSVTSYVESPISVYFKYKNWGYLTIGQFIRTETRFELLAEPIRINPITQSPETATFPYLSHIENSQMYFSHSLPLINIKYAKVSVGSRIKFNNHKLYQEVLFIDFINDGFDGTANMSNYLEDKYSTLGYGPTAGGSGLGTQSSINFDVGIQAETRYVSVGIQILDLSRQNIPFVSLGNNCAELQGYSQDSCFAARSVADKVELNRRLKIRPKSVVSVNVHNAKRNLNLSLAVESIDKDSSNLKSQWAFVSFQTKWKILVIPIKINLNYAANITDQGNLEAINIQSVPLADRISGLSIGLFNTLEFFINKSEQSISSSVTQGIDDSKIPSPLLKIAKNGDSFSNDYYFGVKLGFKF